MVERFVGGLKVAGVEFSAIEADDGNQPLHHSYSTNVVIPFRVHGQGAVAALGS